VLLKELIGGAYGRRGIGGNWKEEKKCDTDVLLVPLGTYLARRFQLDSRGEKQTTKFTAARIQRNLYPYQSSKGRANKGIV